MRQHVIIFDSPDRCGKTEMAKELSKRIEVPYFKNVRESRFFETDPGYFVKAMKYADPYFTGYLKQTGASVILDRSFPSEFVYSRALGRETDMDMLRMVDTLFADVDARIIIPYRTDYSGFRDDKFDVLDSKMLEKLDSIYREFMLWTSCKTLRLCVDDENLNREMREIKEFLG